MSNSQAWGRALLDSGPAMAYLALALLALGALLWLRKQGAGLRRGPRWRLAAALMLCALFGVGCYAAYQNVLFQYYANYFRSKDDPDVP